MSERAPLSCPECGTSLMNPGTVNAWIDPSEIRAAHLEQGEEGVIIVIDKAEKLPETNMQCNTCGKDLDNFEIEDIDYDPECEFDEDD